MNIDKIMNPEPIFKIPFFGYTIPITESIIMMWIIMVVIIIFAYVFTRNLKTVPTGKQNITELIVDMINGLMKTNIGHHWRPFAPYFGTLLIFLGFSNMASLFSIIPTGAEFSKLTGIKFFAKLPEFSITPPTKDLNVTAALAIISILLVLFCGIGYKGISGWLKGFLKPSPVMLPFHILDYATRTLTLSLRLFGNILAGFVIAELILSAPFFVKPLLPLSSFFFDMFDALLQAYIFVFLSSIYISEAIE
jgi:F-type H+-transporting ATPase subunit a